MLIYSLNCWKDGEDGLSLLEKEMKYGLCYQKKIFTRYGQRIEEYFYVALTRLREQLYLCLLLQKRSSLTIYRRTSCCEDKDEVWILGMKSEFHQSALLDRNRWLGEEHVFRYCPTGGRYILHSFTIQIDLYICLCKLSF